MAKQGNGRLPGKPGDTGPANIGAANIGAPTIATTLPDLPRHKAGGNGPTPARNRTLSFAEMLVEAGMVSADEVYKAQEAARREGVPLVRILVRDGLVLSKDLAAFMALHLGLTMVDLRSEAFDPDIVGLLPEDIARRYIVLPLRKEGETLTVAMADPTDLQAIQDLTARTGLTIEPVVASDQELQEHIVVAYRQVLAPSGGGESGSTLQVGGARLTPAQLRNAQPARLVEMLLQQALHDGASDIHVEPTETRLRIRFRIDGILHETMTLPLDIHPALISRMKIMSGMNIAERRRPQDGQLTFEGPEGRVDVRAAVASTVHGEMAVLRLLDNKKLTLLGLDQLGMRSGLDSYRHMLRLPHGMVVVCGPTGSGKSTTLAASLLTMNRSELNVITVEDPVENEIPDANQMQVNRDAGVTFASQLRAILRLDPDVILVGEIRDKETADIATQAALTGHLVLSTLHANDAVSALIRLRDLGVQPFLIASSLVGVVAQRMVRKVDAGCAAMEPRPITEQKAFEADIGERQEAFIYGAGCNSCAQTGYRGRTGIYEVLTMTDELRQLFLNDASRDVLTEQALKDGVIPLRRDGMYKVKDGITTPYEVMRVTVD